MVKAAGKHTIVNLNPDQTEEWRELVAPVRDDWTRTTRKTGAWSPASPLTSFPTARTRTAIGP